jgi:hypothetical protein
MEQQSVDLSVLDAIKDAGFDPNMAVCERVCEVKRVLMRDNTNEIFTISLIREYRRGQLKWWVESTTGIQKIDD